MAHSKYDRVVQPSLAVIEGWMRNGLTLDQVASNLRISKTTLIKYRDEHPELLNALKAGKEEADIAVENALFKAATGYTFTDEVATPSGKVVRVTKYEKPNTTAQIFWLKNRKPKDWRDQKTVEHSTETGKPLEVSHDVHGALDDYLDAIAQVALATVGGDAPDDGAPESVDSGEAHAETGDLPDPSRP